jgi:hypothetical protein
MHSVDNKSDCTHFKPEDLEVKKCFIGTICEAIVARMQFVL